MPNKQRSYVDKKGRDFYKHTGRYNETTPELVKNTPSFTEADLPWKKKKKSSVVNHFRGTKSFVNHIS